MTATGRNGFSSVNPKVTAVENRAKEYFGDVNPAHDWFHVQRVCETSVALAREEGADLETVRLAALFHDIGRGREDRGEIEEHAAWGATEAESILENVGYGRERIEAVTHCIRAHRYSRPPEPRSLEAKVLADADNLDAIGAVGIARTFTYGAERGAPIADPGLPAAEDDSPAGATSLNHLRKKILTLRERMYTDAGRRRARDRHDYVESFIERLEAELAGRK
ncbi:HD domain-containing protein [Natrialbaceae archaeon A-gly3]